MPVNSWVRLRPATDHRRTTIIEVETTEENEDNEGEMREQMIIDGNLIDNPLPSSTEERAGVRSRKYYFDGGPVKIAAELLHELDADGNQPRVVKLTQQAVPAPNGGAR